MREQRFRNGIMSFSSRPRSAGLFTYTFIPASALGAIGAFRNFPGHQMGIGSFSSRGFTSASPLTWPESLGVSRWREVVGHHPKRPWSALISACLVVHHEGGAHTNNSLPAMAIFEETSC